MRAAIYARVSTEEQTRGHSIDGQISDLRSHCDREGYSLSEDHVFVAAGESGASIGPTLKRLLECAHKNEFDILAVCNVDRFSRDPRTAFNVLYDLEQCGIRFVATDEEIDYSTEDGRVAAVDRIADAYKERTRFRQRSRKGMERAIRKGLFCGGIVPYGYQLNTKTKRLEIDEEEAEVVRLIFTLCADEGLSTKKIAARLNALGIPPRYAKDGIEFRRPGRRSKEHSAGVWRGGRVNHMLKYTGYYGEWWWGRRSKSRSRQDWIKGAMPAIISDKLFDRAQVQLRANTKFNRRNAHRHYLLRGLGRCELCGYTYIGTYSVLKSGRERRYYKCNGRNTGDVECPSLTLRAAEIEDVVWQDIKGFVSQPKVVLGQLEDLRQPQQQELDRFLEEAEAQLKEKARAEGRLLRLYASDVKFTEQALGVALEEVNTDREQLYEYRDRLLKQQQDEQLFDQQITDAQGLLTALRDRIDDATFEEKRNAALKLVKGISVGVVEMGGERKPKVTITYRFSEPGPERSIPLPHLHTTGVPLRVLRRPHQGVYLRSIDGQPLSEAPLGTTAGPH